MKKLFVLLLAATCLASCKKEEAQVQEYWATIHLDATFINRMHADGNDSVYVIVDGELTHAFKTHSNPCHSTSYGYHKSTREKEYSSVYTIKTERSLIESDVLIYTKENLIKSID